MPSIGPFELTDAELLGLEFLGQEDGRELRKMALQATWSGSQLTVKVQAP